MRLIYVNMTDMSSSSDPPLGLGYLLHLSLSALRSDITSTVLVQLELSFPQYICLRLLSKFPGRSNADLARETSVSPQAMNMVVLGLEERGLVSRPTSVASGRSLPAQLTRAGQQLLARTDEGVRAAEQRLMSVLTADQQQEFVKILTRVAAGTRIDSGLTP